jgi:hypothetical protein
MSSQSFSLICVSLIIHLNFPELTDIQKLLSFIEITQLKTLKT